MGEADRYLAAYAAEIAKVLSTVDDESGTNNAPFGDYYVARVVFGFDGEDVTNFRVAPDEHGGYAIHFGELK